MHEYKSKINLLQTKINTLKERELNLINKRKKFIADLAERLALLTISDQCLAGVLLEFKETLSSHPHQINYYETKGNSFLNHKPRCTDIKNNPQPSSSSTSHETATP